MSVFINMQLKEADGGQNNPCIFTVIWVGYEHYDTERTTSLLSLLIGKNVLFAKC